MGQGGVGADAGDRLIVDIRKKLLRLIPASARRRLWPVAQRLHLVATEDYAQHPERLAVLDRLSDVTTDLVVEVGCGPRKTHNEFVGLDLTAGGNVGRFGSAAGRASQADVAGNGAYLPFRSRSCAAIAARHNLEHYVDLVSVLREWHRVVRPGGRLVAVVPDEESYPGRTVALDPTHYHAFSASSIENLFPLTGWQVLEIGPCVRNWSLLVVARRL